MPKIFISYRRHENKLHAAIIFDRLSRVYGKNVFLDTRSIEAGDSFWEEIAKNLIKSDVLLIIIGRDWVGIKNKNGNPKIFDSDDYVRKEILLALAADLKIVPVLVDSAVMPEHDVLPRDLWKIVDKQAFSFDVDRHSDYKLAGLVKIIDGGNKLIKVKFFCWLFAVFFIIAAYFYVNRMQSNSDPSAIDDNSSGTKIINLDPPGIGNQNVSPVSPASGSSQASSSPASASPIDPGKVVVPAASAPIFFE